MGQFPRASHRPTPSACARLPAYSRPVGGSEWVPTGRTFSAVGFAASTFRPSAAMALLRVSTWTARPGSGRALTYRPVVGCLFCTRRDLQGSGRLTEPVTYAVRRAKAFGSGVALVAFVAQRAARSASNTTRLVTGCFPGSCADGDSLTLVGSPSLTSHRYTVEAEQSLKRVAIVQVDSPAARQASSCSRVTSYFRGRN
jgi:hypothetical protein